MNYEELYAQLTPLEKDLKDSANLIVKLQKAVSTQGKRNRKHGVTVVMASRLSHTMICQATIIS